MTKNRYEVIAAAHRHIGILSADEAPSADQDAYAGGVLDALFAEMNTVQGLGLSWTVEAVPDDAFLPLSRLLAVEVAPHYGVLAEPRARAVARLRAYALPDDREDARDTDDDGVVSDEEKDAAARALYY